MFSVFSKTEIFTKALFYQPKAHWQVCTYSMAEIMIEKFNSLEVVLNIFNNANVFMIHIIYVLSCFN